MILQIPKLSKLFKKSRLGSKAVDELYDVLRCVCIRVCVRERECVCGHVCLSCTHVCVCVRPGSKAVDELYAVLRCVCIFCVRMCVCVHAWVVRMYV